MRRILCALLLSVALSTSVGCFIPIYSGDPTRRTQQLIFTSEDLRVLLEEWERFWFVTAILSLILGFMNLLPIPALDGGHVMFLIWEVITGRKPSDRFMEITTIIGFVIIIGLVLYANWLDVMRFFG